MTTLIYEISNSIALLTINKPYSLNALNQQTLEELLTFLEQTAIKEKIKAVILTGSGNKAFIAGADIKAMQTMTELEMLRFSQMGQCVANGLENAPLRHNRCCKWICSGWWFGNGIGV